MTLWLSPAVGKRASSDVAAASLRMQTVAIGDIPYIPASPTTDRQPKMKLESHCPSLGCEGVAGGSRLLTSYYLVWRPCAHATPSVPPVQLLALGLRSSCWSTRSSRFRNCSHLMSCETGNGGGGVGSGVELPHGT